MKRTIWFGAPALAFTFGLSHAALAQDTATAQAGGEANGQVQLGGGASGAATGSSGAMGLPGAEPAQAAPAPATAAPPPAAAPAPAAAAPGDSDHDQMVGRLAIGYLGTRGLQVGCFGPAPCNGTSQVVSAPVVGVRYWIDGMLGIDAGLGIGINSISENDDPGPDAAQPSTHAFILHGGIPLALASSGHFSFQVIPEMNVGFGGFSQDAPGDDQKGSGFRLDLGARAGAEIHFGFIGIPQLSLQGSIGAGFAYSTYTQEQGPGKAKISTIAFGTSVQDSPWNIFTSNVSALYYF